MILAVSEATSITELIGQARAGDETALATIFKVAYDDLRAMASRRLRAGGRGLVLDTTALVHESYLRFSEAGRLNAADRAHFLNYAGRVMRSVIVDFVRERRAQRRGGDAIHVTLDTGVSEAVDTGEDEILRVHEALEELSRHDEKLVHVVELRYFAGLSEAEVAESLGVHVRTVRRYWEKARLLLADALQIV
jgi:RNA polymerase sigma factor (TIGR02999 family)